MPSPEDKGKPGFIKKTPELNELRSGLLFYNAKKNLDMSIVSTPAVFTVKNNNVLPSYEKIPSSLPETSKTKNVMTREKIAVKAFWYPMKGLMESLKKVPGSHSTIDWVGGLGVIPLVNMTQIAITTLLEFGIRTLGAAFVQPLRIVNGLINDSDMNSTAKTFWKGVAFAVNSPLWCIGQTFSLAADAIAYTKQLIDSGIRLINPLWWGAKIINKIKGKEVFDSDPSFKSVTSTFVSSIIKLLPAAAIITAGVLTAGVSIPILQGLAGPIQAGLSTALNTVIASVGGGVAGITLASLTAVLASGAIAAISKTFSGLVNGVTRELTTKEEKNEEKKIITNFRPKKKTPSADTTHILKGLTSEMELAPPILDSKPSAESREGSVHSDEGEVSRKREGSLSSERKEPEPPKPPEPSSAPTRRST